MMKVKYYGNSCFVFKSKEAKLITNPKDAGVKVNLKSLKCDIVVLSHKDKIKENEYYLVKSPGEYEVKDIFIYGYTSNIKKADSKQAYVYMFDVENVHLGFIDKSVDRVREQILNEMGIVDVLFVSLADDSNLKQSKLVDLVNKVEPQVVVPMDYNTKKLEEFSKVLGVKGMEKEDYLNVSKSDFLEEEAPMRLVVLTE